MRKLYIIIIAIIALILAVLSLSALAMNLPVYENLISPNVSGFLEKYGKEPNYVTEPINEIALDDIGPDGFEYLGIHLDTYHAIDSVLTFFIGEAEEVYLEMVKGTEDFNVRSYCRYFGITKEEFLKLYDYILSDKEKLALNTYLQYITSTKGIYGTQEEYISVFVRKGYESKVPDTCIPEGDDTHTYSYHSVPVEFAEYVGKDNWGQLNNSIFSNLV